MQELLELLVLLMRKYNFSPEQKEEIVELYLSGSTAPEIRRAFNIVGDSTVYTILHEYKVPLRLKKPGVTTSKVRKSERNGVEVDSELPVDERLPEDLPHNSPKKRFRVTLKVKLTFDADTMEAALVKAKGYNGYQEVLSVSRIG